LLPVAGIDGIMVIDLVTFLAAVATLLPMSIPSPKQPPVERQGAAFATQLGFGFHYIRRRPGLLGLLVIFMGIEFFAALTYFSVLPALILARTGGDELALATVQATIGIAGILGGLLVS